MLVACNFNKKETPAQVLTCEFCKIFQNAYFVDRLPTVAGVIERLTWTYFYFLFILLFSMEVIRTIKQIISTFVLLIKSGITEYIENITFSFKMFKCKLSN